MNRPVEIKPGVRVEFNDNDGKVARGTVNGDPWIYWDGELHARIPVYVDDGRTLDVYGGNLREAGAPYGPNVPLTIVHEPDSPDLWVVYRGNRRLSQHETQEAAASWIRDYPT
jgi:hypothetical protein